MIRAGPAARRAAVVLTLLYGCGRPLQPGPPSMARVAPRVEVGLERIDAERGGVLRGRRIGLLMHAASVTADGRRAVDVLRTHGVEVVRLFSPEHGISGQAAAGEKVAHGVDAETGLPVVSLYGERLQPRPEDLAGLDALVVDFQEAGVRFYTYMSTLLYLLRDRQEVEVVVLDRPNPLGGDRVEGPLAEPQQVARSHVSTAPGPLVHGLTLGEMARYVSARATRAPRLTVVPMRGWKREMTWADTGRAWVNPSPNLRSGEAALAYPGVALLEATNLSEGRGTEAPFLLFGAPWLDSAALIEGVAAPGYALEPARFTPVASPAAPRPKHEGRECYGVRVRVTDARAAAPYRLGIALLHGLRRQPAFEWSRARADHLDWLLGTRKVRRALERGDTVDAIVAADAGDIAAWRRDRRPFLLY